jgi:hypothetical protein
MHRFLHLAGEPQEMNRQIALLIPVVLACSSPLKSKAPDGGSPDVGVTGSGGAMAGGSTSTSGGGRGGTGVANIGSGGTGGAPSGCVSPCALFELDISSTTSPRNNIEECRLTITDQNGNLALHNFLLPAVYGADSSHNLVLVSGCGLGLTRAKIGTFTYSTPLTSGSLTFRVDALDSNGVIAQTGSSTQTIEAFPPKITVPLTISAPTP